MRRRIWSSALAAFKPEVLRAMARLFVESIFGLYRTRARRDGLRDGECGAVTFVQRFGGSLNLNVHMHVVVLDGVYVRDADHGVVFHTATPPTLVELEAIVRRVRERALLWLRRRGLLNERPLEERSNEAPERGRSRRQLERRGWSWRCTVGVCGGARRLQPARWRADRSRRRPWT